MGYTLSKFRCSDRENWHYSDEQYLPSFTGFHLVSIAFYRDPVKHDKTLEKKTYGIKWYEGNPVMKRDDLFCLFNLKPVLDALLLTSTSIIPRGRW